MRKKVIEIIEQKLEMFDRKLEKHTNIVHEAVKSALNDLAESLTSQIEEQTVILKSLIDQIHRPHANGTPKKDQTVQVNIANTPKRTATYGHQTPIQEHQINRQ